MSNNYQIRVISADHTSIAEGNHPEKSSLQVLPGTNIRVYVQERGITSKYNGNANSPHPRDLALLEVSKLVKALTNSSGNVNEFDFTLGLD